MMKIQFSKSYLLFFLLLVLAVAGCGGGGGPDGERNGNQYIIDHTCTDLTRIPQDYIQTAISSLHIYYGHTSHGSQVTNGMSGLVAFINGGGLGLSYPNNLFQGLDLNERTGSDLGDASTRAEALSRGWIETTRNYLSDHTNINVVMWSWCGQVSNASREGIEGYLAAMSTLERDYPNVKFVYMTGHLDGSGLTGNLHQRNEQIREYCRTNNKILYDFADIETWGPDPSSDNSGDSSIYYGDKYPTDGCCYDANNSGSTTPKEGTTPTNGDSNWAYEWQTAHPDKWYDCTSEHSQPLNANRKAFAAWWLWARLAGWDGN